MIKTVHMKSGTWKLQNELPVQSHLIKPIFHLRPYGSSLLIKQNPLELFGFRSQNGSGKSCQKDRNKNFQWFGSLRGESRSLHHDKRDSQVRESLLFTV